MPAQTEPYPVNSFALSDSDPWAFRLIALLRNLGYTFAERRAVHHYIREFGSVQGCLALRDEDHDDLIEALLPDAEWPAWTHRTVIRLSRKEFPHV